MIIKKITRIGIGFLSIVLLSGPIWAVETIQGVAGYAMPLTREGGTARAMSMGSAVVGVPMGSASLFWNPAGLGVMGECNELGLHHNTGLGESTHETVVLGMPMGLLGGFAASLNYVNNGIFEGRDAAGNKVDDYSAGDMGASVGWGKEWFPGLSLGVAVKYNRQTLGSMTYSATAADMGVLWNAFKRFNLGVTYSNLGTPVAGSLLDSGWRVGASYGLDKNTLLAGSGELKRGGFGRAQVGVESFVHPIIALRAGLVHNFSDAQLDGNNGVTAGIGIIIIENMMFDYAYIPYGDLGTSNRISLTYKFHCPKKVVKAEPKPEPVATPKPVPVPKPVIVQNVIILEKLIVLEDGHFEFDSSALTKDGVKTVAENAQILRDNPESKIRVAGYASAQGTTEYNQKLSERRAMAVKEILIREGDIAPGRITTIGYGDTRPAMFEPIPSNIDSKEAQANMRVLFEIIVK